MNKREKKFFSPVLKHYSYDLSKRWRIEWLAPHPDYIHGKRAVEYGNINSGKTVNERVHLATLLIQSLDFQPKSEKTILHQVMASSRLEWRDKTYSTYKTIVTAFCTDFPRPEHVVSIDIQNFLVKLKEQGKSQTTLKKYRDVLAYLYTKARKLKLIDYNPVDTEIRIKKSHQSLLYFTDAHIQLFKSSNVGDQLWLAIRLLFYCFIRPGEQRHMRIDWINWDAGYIEIPGAYSKNKKTEKVSIPNRLLSEIEYLKLYPNSFYVLSKSGQPGPDQIAVNWLNSQYTKVLKSLGIRGRFAFYSWKHTGAVMCVKAGINIKDLQLQLRHHSLDMVNEYLKNLGVMDSDDLKSRFPSL